MPKGCPETKVSHMHSWLEDKVHPVWERKDPGNCTWKSQSSLMLAGLAFSCCTLVFILCLYYSFTCFSITWHCIIAVLRLFSNNQTLWQESGLEEGRVVQHPHLEPFQKVMSIGKQGSVLSWALKMQFGWVTMKIYLNTELEVGPCSNSGHCILLSWPRSLHDFLPSHPFVPLLFHNGHIF